MAERQAELLEMLVGQLDQRLAIDRVVGEQLGILAKALGLQPLSQLGHDRPPRGRRHNLEAQYGLRSVDCRRRSVLQIWAPPTCLCRAAARGGLSPAGAVARVRCSAVPFLLALWLG